MYINDLFMHKFESFHIYGKLYCTLSIMQTIPYTYIKERSDEKWDAQLLLKKYMNC